MVSLKLRDVHAIRKKVGGKWKVYYYHRRTRERLPDDPSTFEFMQALIAAKNPIPRSDAGTIGALITAYLGSAEFSKLRPASKAHYRWACDYLRKLDDLPLEKVKKHHILSLRDTLKDKVGRYNTFTSVMRLLFAFAADRELIPHNPVTDMKRQAMGEYKRWPDTAITKFLEAATPMMRRALILALYSGQRQSDCLAMRWSQYDGEALTLKQIKTGAELWIPCHTALKAELDAAKKGATSVFILHSATGQPWTRHGFSGAWRRLTVDAGCKGLTFHGLRKNAAAQLAEAGCSDREIQAITGHESVAMIGRYTKQADQRIRGRAAMGKLENKK